jgi:hypothetical protein
MTTAAIIAFLTSFNQLSGSAEGQAIIALALSQTNFPVEKVAAHADALKPAPPPNERT